MEKNLLISKNALPPSMLSRALQMPRPSTLWALQWNKPDQSIQNLKHYRYYASVMGRFLNPDNMIPNATNPLSWNLYSYVNGNPVDFNDPTGHGPNVRTLPNYFMQGNHSFGMSWFDQFRDGPAYLPWFGQTAENSWYSHVSGVGLPPAGVNYGPAAVAPQDEAMLAKFATNPDNATLPASWTIKMMTSDESSGFQAFLFYNTQTGQYVIAFAGSNELRDYLTAAKHWFARNSAQLIAARAFTDSVLAMPGVSTSNLSLTGHSLGGGLAAVMAVEYGLHASTFNALGVNSRTLGGREGLVRAMDLVTNYFKAGEWLTTLQLITPLPDAIGVQVFCGFGGHGIDDFILGP